MSGGSGQKKSSVSSPAAKPDSRPVQIQTASIDRTVQTATVIKTRTPGRTTR